MGLFSKNTTVNKEESKKDNRIFRAKYPIKFDEENALLYEDYYSGHSVKQSVENMYKLIESQNDKGIILPVELYLDNDKIELEDKFPYDGNEEHYYIDRATYCAIKDIKQVQLVAWSLKPFLVIYKIIGTPTITLYDKQ